MHRGQMLIMAVNTKNEPVWADFSIGKSITGKARVIFENRFRQTGNCVADKIETNKNSHYPNGHFFIY